MTVTKTLLVRSAPFELTRASQDGDGLTFEGYAALFNAPTEIHSRMEAFDLGIEGPHFREQIAPGAFNKTIADRAQWPLIDFEHGRHPLIGSMPIGIISKLSADAKGLFVRARLTDSWLIDPVRAAVRDGAVTGMSFRAEAISEKVDRNANPPMVTRTELRLLDLGPVTRPAYADTTATVRSREIAAALRDPDARLDLARALLGPAEETPAAETPAPDTVVSFDNEPPSDHHESDASSGHEAGRPPEEGHPPSVDRDEPPQGHSSMSSGEINAQLARINSEIEFAERSAHNGH